MENLSPGSALHRSARGNDWQDLEHLVAEGVDTLRNLLALTNAVNSKNSKFKPPPLVPRPGDASEDAPDREVEARAQHDALKNKLLPARG